QLYDDVDIRLNEPVDTDEGFVQEEGTDAKTEVPVTSSSHSSDLLAKFLNFSDIPHLDAKIVSPLDVYVQHEFNNRVTAFEKEVDELKKDPLYTQVTALVDDHLDARLGATKDEFMNFLLASLTMVKESLKDAILAKESSQSILIEEKPKDKDEDPSAGSDRGLKKRKTSKDAEPAKGPKAKESQSSSSKGDKSKSKSSRKFVQSEEPKFEVADSDMPHDQKENPGNDDEEPKEKTKAVQYDLPGIKDKVTNIWSPVKVADDKHALWGISHYREQFTQVEIMRKHGYGYLQEIVVRRADNNLYRFKEADFPRLRINDIKDMLLLVVHKWLTNLSETTKFGIKKRDPYTPYQDHQGFIYVNDSGRNMLIHLDELYKFSDGTLTRLRTSMVDITKNIRMEYLPKRRWSTMEKKRANIMIYKIDKHLKERKIMRSLEKFVGRRDYITDLRLLQRTI
nr:hypothetical protein [Tanacetum cinerariifolium]